MTSSDPQTISKAQAWFTKLWNASKTIGPKDLADAQIRWQLRRAVRPPSTRPKGSLLDAVSANPSEFADKRIFVVSVNEELSDQGEEDLEEASVRAGGELHAYEQWPDIPLNATLICFSDYGDGLTQDEPPIYTTANRLMKGRLQFVFPKGDVLGYSLGSFNRWKSRLNYLAKHRPKKWKSGDMCMDLVEFVAETNQA